MLSSCTRNEIKVSFDVDDTVNSPVRIVYYASSRSQGIVRETAVEIASGKGEIILPTRFPAIVYLFSPSKKEPALAFYAERGDKIRVTGNNPDVGKWEVSGNKITDAWSEWRNENDAVLAKNDTKAVNKAVTKYVEDHPDNPLSVVLLGIYYSRREDPEGYYRLYGRLSEAAFANRELVGALAAADLIEPLQKEWFVGKGGISAPSKMILRGQDGFADTIVLKDTVNTLLVFVGKDGMEPAVRDSLKTRKKSDKGKVAEIYLDPDSLAWDRYLRRDTVEVVKRVMMPLGLMDSVAMKIGVDRYPYYFTIGEKGKLLYRGDDFEKAYSIFKKGRN